MNIFARLRRWYQTLQRKRNYARYKAGYDWVLLQYYGNETPVCVLENQIKCARDFNSFDDFDRGALDAIKDIPDKKVGTAEADELLSALKEQGS
jgi:hypothetical protein